MITSSLLLTIGYIFMGEWLKANIVALLVMATASITSYTAGQVSTAISIADLTSRIITVEDVQKESLQKYIPTIERLDKGYAVLERDVDKLFDVVNRTAGIAQENTVNIRLLLDDRVLLRSMNNNLDDLSIDVGVVKNEVINIKEKLQK